MGAKLPCLCGVLVEVPRRNVEGTDNNSGVAGPCGADKAYRLILVVIKEMGLCISVHIQQAVLELPLPFLQF